VRALDDSGALGNDTDIANAALEHELPVMADDRTVTKRLIGGRMADGPNGENQSQRAAADADRLIRGASPASLPIEQPGQIDVSINLQTAKPLACAPRPG
jgi:putative ABC transport system substrate-binding protein